MQVHIKTPAEIDFMRESGTLLASLFLMLDDFVKEGISTLEINNQVEHFIRKTLHARPASLGQYGYEFLLNSSVNEVVCHGVPSDSQKLKANARRTASVTLRQSWNRNDIGRMHDLHH